MSQPAPDCAQALCAGAARLSWNETPTLPAAHDSQDATLTNARPLHLGRMQPDTDRATLAPLAMRFRRMASLPPAAFDFHSERGRSYEPSLSLPEATPEQPDESRI
jgi:hypothetical protein